MPAPHPALAPGLSYGPYHLQPPSITLWWAWITSAPSNSPRPSRTHHKTAVSSASHLGVVWWVVGFSRPTLKPLKTYASSSVISKYLKLAFMKREPCSLSNPHVPELKSASTRHQIDQSRPFSETKTGQTSCLASRGPSTNTLENRWWPKARESACLHKLWVLVYAYGLWEAQGR